MSRRAFTLVETLVAAALGAILLAAVAIALRSASWTSTRSSGRDAAVRELNKARRQLESDLALMSLKADRFQILPAPASLGGGSDGDVIHILSPVNTTTEQLVSLEDGSGNPYFFLNRFYYPTVPLNHDTLFGITCTGGNEAGYDYNCPHKILIRGVEDQNPTFDPTESASEDILHPALTTFLIRPTGFPKNVNRNTLAVNLLSLRAQALPGEVSLELQAVALAEARKRGPMGNQSFRQSPFTLTQRFSVFPKN